MIPVAANHAGDVVDRDQLPGFVADVLPARNLFEDEKAHFVAGIEEMTGLWIARSAYDVAVEVVAQDAGVATLRAAGHGLADEGKRTHFALSTIPSFPRCLRRNGPSRPKKRSLAGSTSATNPGS